jgi:HEAT repeats
MTLWIMHIEWSNRAAALLVIPLTLAVVVILAAQRTEFGIVMLQQCAPFLLPSSQLARNLESTNTDVVRESLGILADRRDPVAVDRAIQLLQSSDDYVWLNAAQYLGAVRRSQAVPYLIKAFRHTAWRSDGERLTDLQLITGQSFPADFRAWSNWWAAAHPDAAFDFDSHLGPVARR